MGTEWTDWADGKDLAGISRSTDPLARAGYDLDQARTDPELRRIIMGQAASPYGLQPAAAAQPMGAAASSAPVGRASNPGSAAARTVQPPTSKAPTADNPIAASPGASTNGSQPENQLDVIGREALEKGLSLGDMAGQSSEALSKEAGQFGHEESQLTQQEAKDALPTPYYDPQTGKPLESASQYKPTMLQRIGRGFENTLTGLREGGVFGAAEGAANPASIRSGVAYNAPNRAYQVAEMERQARLANDKAQIANLRQNFGTAINAGKTAADVGRTGVDAFYGVQRGVAAMQPKSIAQKPIAGIGPDGKLTFATPVGDGRFEGPDGQILSSFAPAPKEPKQATDAFDQWKNDPGSYEKFMAAMQTIKDSGKGEKGAYGGFGPAFLAYHMLTGAYNENPALLPVIAPLLANMLSSAGGGNAGDYQRMLDALSKLPAGQPHDTAGQAIGLRMPGSPTGATRSRGQFAQSILPTVNQAEQQINALGADVGPLKGHFYDLYEGKAGFNAPKYAGLNFALHNIGTAWMRLHANSDSARQEFEHLLRTSQTPEDLMAGLRSLDSQAQDYVKEGEGRPDQLGGKGAGAKPSPGAGGGGKSSSGSGAFNWGSGFRELGGGKK